MPFDHLLVESGDHVATVTINRPKVLNALDTATLREIDRAMRGLRDDTNVRTIVITGAGGKAFVAGADVREFVSMTPGEGRAYAAVGQGVLDLIEHLGKPVIAAVNGYALGGGCELAMACTIRLAADTAMFGQPEVKLGLMAGFGGTQRLPRLVGKGRALELLLRGEMIDAAEAWRIGLVNRVVPAASLLEEARSLARDIAANAPVAVRHSIEAVNHGLEPSGTEGAFTEAALFGLLFATEDVREGVLAFVEKRKPAFTGR
jgi:enoyl-CoA hydratase